MRLRNHVLRALALLALLPGCSLLMTRAPSPVRHPEQPIECTRSRVAPVLDTACAAAFGAAAGAVWLFDDGPRSTRSPYIGVAVGAGACLVSALYGYDESNRCEAVRRQNTLCIGGDQAACRALAPGWRPAPPP